MLLTNLTAATMRGGYGLIEDAAILVDPTGAAIGVHAWAGRGAEEAR